MLSINRENDINTVINIDCSHIQLYTFIKILLHNIMHFWKIFFFCLHENIFSQTNNDLFGQEK